MRYVSYLRVSTTKQGLDGYGMGAQQEAVTRYTSSVAGELLAEFREVESGACNDRPQLALAIQTAKANKACLLIARLDRLSRNASFLMSLQESHLDFVCCDMPSADKFTIGILALVAQKERELISARVKAGLAVAKSRGVTLGNPNASKAWKTASRAIQERKQGFAARAMESIKEVQSAGIDSLNRIADCLNKRGEKTARGGRWTATAVKRVIEISALFGGKSVVHGL